MPASHLTSTNRGDVHVYSGRRGHLSSLLPVWGALRVPTPTTSGPKVTTFVEYMVQSEDNYPESPQTSDALTQRLV